MLIHRHHPRLPIFLHLLLIAFFAACSGVQPDTSGALPPPSATNSEVEEQPPAAEQPPAVDLFASEPVKSTLDIRSGGFSGFELHDMNGDGSLDLVATDFYEGFVRIYTNDGLGEFQSTDALPVGAGPSGLTLADFDADGALDMAISHPEEGGISLLLDGGSGQFMTPISVSDGESPTFLRTADFEMDGDIDLMVNDYYSSEINILRNDGAGRFSPDDPIVLTAGGKMVTEVSDLNNDAYPDAVVAHPIDAIITVLLNDGGGTLGEADEYAVGTSPQAVAIADLDGDNAPDLVVTSRTGTVSIFMNDGNGAFVEGETFEPGGGLMFGLLADMNGDGQLDLLVANEGAFNVHAFANLGDGTFAHQTDYSAFPAAPRHLHLADIDSDGIDELLAVGMTKLAIFDFAD